MQERKEKLVINQKNCFQTGGRRSLLYLTNIYITIKRNGSMNMIRKRAVLQGIVQ